MTMVFPDDIRSETESLKVEVADAVRTYARVLNRAQALEEQRPADIQDDDACSGWRDRTGLTGLWDILDVLIPTNMLEVGSL